MGGASDLARVGLFLSVVCSLPCYEHCSPVLLPLPTQQSVELAFESVVDRALAVHKLSNPGMRYESAPQLALTPSHQRKPAIRPS